MTSEKLLGALYRYANDHPNWTAWPLRLLIPLLARLKVMTEGRRGEILTDIAELIDYRIYTQTQLCNGASIKVPMNDLVGTEIYRHGCYEPETVQVVEKILTPGMVFLDVGAHVGQYTLLASQLIGPQGQVHSFEPDPATYSVLKENIQTNRLSNVRAVQAALASQNERATLHLSTARNMGTNSLRESPYSSGKTCTVRTMTLPRYIEQNSIHRIDLIKLDVEGAEIDILNASEALIRRHKPMLVVELNESANRRFGHEPATLQNTLKSLGYTILRISSSGLTPLKTDDATELSYFNVLATLPDHKVPPELFHEIKNNAIPIAQVSGQASV